VIASASAGDVIQEGEIQKCPARAATPSALTRPVRKTQVGPDNIIRRSRCASARARAIRLATWAAVRGRAAPLGLPFLKVKDHRLGPRYSPSIGSLARASYGRADEHLPSTARIHRWARRRGGMAACGARAAAGKLLSGSWVRRLFACETASPCSF
jgi:hypothetical protein